MGLRNRERFNKEQIIIKETSFCAQEVESFRELFLTNCDASGQLSLQAVMNMIDMISPLGEKYISEFRSFFHAIKSRHMHWNGCWDHIDFPEFLLLMHKLLDNNFACIKDKTSSVAKTSNAT